MVRGRTRVKESCYRQIRKKEERFAERENKTLEENRGQTFEQRDERLLSRRSLESQSNWLGRKNLSRQNTVVFGKLIKGSEKTNIIEGKPIPQLIEEIEAYIARDREN